MRYRLALIATVAGVAAALAGCSSSSDPAPAAVQSTEAGASFPVTVSNCGQELTFEAPPQRVVVLQPLIARDMVALGLGNRIVGQSGTDYIDPEPEMADVPVVSSKNVTSTEALLGTRPDLVMSDYIYRLTPSQGGASLDQLQQAGVPSYVSTGGCDLQGVQGKVEDGFTDLANLGQIFGVPEKAKALITSLQAQLTEVQERVADQPEVSVFEGTAYNSDYYPVAGIGLDALQLAGGTSIFPDVTDANASISKEQITARDPAAIVYSSSTATLDEEQVTSELQSAFPTVSAVKAGRVHFINYVVAQEPGSAVAMVDTVEQIAKFLHPSAFSE